MNKYSQTTKKEM